MEEEGEGARRRRRVAEEEAERAFDLERGPLVRVKLVRMGEAGACAAGDDAPHRE